MSVREKPYRWVRQSMTLFIAFLVLVVVAWRWWVYRSGPAMVRRMYTLERRLLRAGYRAPQGSRDRSMLSLRLLTGRSRRDGSTAADNAELYRLSTWSTEWPSEGELADAWRAAEFDKRVELSTAKGRVGQLEERIADLEITIAELSAPSARAACTATGCCST